jgi:hypothetical protein
MAIAFLLNLLAGIFGLAFNGNPYLVGANFAVAGMVAPDSMRRR